VEVTIPNMKSWVKVKLQMWNMHLHLTNLDKMLIMCTHNGK
jgi:hypothetical protein